MFGDSSGKRRRVEACSEDGEGNMLLLQGISFASKVPLFSSLQPTELPNLAMAFISAVYETGQTVMRQGAFGNELFIIQSGSAVMTEKRPGIPEPVEVSVLSSGDYFGEASLLRDVPAYFTVKALTSLKLWVLERGDLEKLGLRHRLHFRKRQAVHEGRSESEDGTDGVRGNQEHAKPEAVRQLLLKSLTANESLSPVLAPLSDEDLCSIVDSAFLVHVQSGTDVIRQGELDARFFYVVEDGTLDVLVAGKEVHRLGPNSSFGEGALLFRESQTSTIRAITPCTLWAVPRREFKRLARGPLRQKLDEYAKLLDRAKALENMDKYQLADALVKMTFFKNEFVVKTGEAAFFFVLYHGEVVVEVDGQERNRLHGHPSDGKADVFGESALREDQLSTATLRTVSEKAMVLVLERWVFQKVVQPSAAEVKADTTNGVAKVEYKMEQLEDLGLLGCGSYAKVSLVTDRETKRLFALKTISKGRVLQRQQVQQVQTERLVLKTTRSPFLIELVATFSTGSHIMFLLEPAMGGDLFTVCERHDLFHSARHARFYIACALEGLVHLHDRCIVYRDLKLENMLLDSSGYCKLADFGLSKFLVGHTYTFCGTPDYMAPEVASGAGHTRAVDWWALGVVAFMLMTGNLPFDSPRPHEVLPKLKRGIDCVLMTTGFGGPFWLDFVAGLCKLEPSERLPVRRGGVENVRQHAWFSQQHFDWTQLQQRAMTPPYMPVVRGGADLTNFDPNPEDAPKDVPYYDPGTGWDVDFAESFGPSSFEQGASS
mmetsp:Transcript_106917/g.300633  ORF Transcript_106917/g.300633 Transcript_106917/m.300633 type:complete len:772 (-) Transcript_106917:121-2436(-)